MEETCFFCYFVVYIDGKVKRYVWMANPDDEHVDSDRSTLFDSFRNMQNRWQEFLRLSPQEQIARYGINTSGRFKKFNRARLP